MASLGVVFDYNLGESFYISKGKQMVEALVDQGKALRQDDGSVIINLKDIETPLLIEKSNGAALYATSDIATIEYREEKWDPEKVIYVVGSEQAFYFRQLFAANESTGWSNAELIHHEYGLIEELDESGKRQKMSSRKNAVYLSDLLQRAQEKARAIAPDDLTEEDITAGIGRFGPFIVHEKDFRSLKEDSVYDITLERALEILSQPKKKRGAKGAKKKAAPKKKK
jgi:arginyl-tRNA synthetase